MFRSRRAAAFAICLLLAIAHTWPLALNPARYSRNENADTELNEWIMAWVAHQLPRHPTQLFAGNIFYPAKDTLAFSEPLIVPALMGAPLAWAGASPVLVYNLVLIAGFALTAFATCLLIEGWTGSMTAGLLAGSAFAFNTHTLTRLPHIQGIHIYALPLALLAFERLIHRRGMRWPLALAGCFALAAYTSGYLVVFLSVAIALALVARLPEWLPHARAILLRLTAAAVAAAVLIVPLYLPYRRAAIEQHMVRTLDTVKEYSATPRGYLTSASRLHGSTWSARFLRDPVDSFFAGVTVLVLSCAALVLAWRRPDIPLLRRRVVMLAAIATVGVILSLGTATPVYGWVFHVFPPMQGLRAAARFGNLFLLGTAMLAGIALAVWKPRPIVAITLLVLVNVEAMRAPYRYTRFEGIPGIYRLLADEPGDVVVVEQPFFPRFAVFENSPYVLASTVHWRPLMNGYSGYTPASYQQYAETFWYFPQEHAIAAMKAAGVTHVVVHVARFHRDGLPVAEVLDKRTDFELMAIGRNGMRLYRLKR